MPLLLQFLLMLSSLISLFLSLERCIILLNVVKKENPKENKTEVGAGLCSYIFEETSI
jgi:hypothetical protein